MAKYKCPLNPSHDRFKIDATVHEVWILNEEGEAIDTIPIGPVDTDPDSVYCDECGDKVKNL